jgi:hypothetical protein
MSQERVILDNLHSLSERVLPKVEGGAVKSSRRVQKSATGAIELETRI